MPEPGPYLPSFVKQECSSTSSGDFDSLDILAAVATQELKLETVEKDAEAEELLEDEDETEEDDEDDGERPPTARQPAAAATRSLQPKKLAELEVVTVQQIRAMSGNTLVRLFAEADFDELKKMYSYRCLLVPDECAEKFQSFGNELKAKKEVRSHLEWHVDTIADHCFTAEPINARKKRLLDTAAVAAAAAARPPIRKRMVRVKVEPAIPVAQTPLPTTAAPPPAAGGGGVEKENSNLSPLKRRKDEDVKPLLSEISNEQDHKRVRIKKEAAKPPDQQQQPAYDPTTAGDGGGALFVSVFSCQEGRVKQEQVEMTSRDLYERAKETRRAIDEDHCYAIRPGNIKQEKQTELDRQVWAAGDGQEAPLRDEESGGYYEDGYGMAVAPVAQVTEVYGYTYNGGGGVSPAAQYSEPAATDGGVTYYQNTDSSWILQATGHLEGGAAHFRQDVVPPSVDSPDTMAGHVVSAAIKQQADLQQQQQEDDESSAAAAAAFNVRKTSKDQPAAVGGRKAAGGGKNCQPDAVRVKNKRTVAAVTSEEKMLALNAMEELRKRGATTEDLECKLCSPPRPFTAYSTLLTHYKSHAGLRPFACNICQATFTRQHSLNYHKMTHANQTRFTCPHCVRKFRHPTHYKEHVKKHGGEVQFACSFCPATFAAQNPYRRHLKHRHGKAVDMVGNVVDVSAATAERSRTAATRRRKVVGEERLAEEYRRYHHVEEVTAEVLDQGDVVLESNLLTQERSSSSDDQEAGDYTTVSIDDVPMAAADDDDMDASEQQQQDGGPDLKFSYQRAAAAATYEREAHDQTFEPVQTAPEDLSTHSNSPIVFVVPKKAEEQQQQNAPVILTSRQYNTPAADATAVQQQAAAYGGGQPLQQGVFAAAGGGGQRVLLAQKKPRQLEEEEEDDDEELAGEEPVEQNGARLQEHRGGRCPPPDRPADLTEQEYMESVLAACSKEPIYVGDSSFEKGPAAAGKEKGPPGASSSYLERYLKYGVAYGDGGGRPAAVGGAAAKSTKEAGGAPNILEQALMQVFPTGSSQLSDFSELVTEAGRPADDLDLYNAKRSPHKNRNMILCDILGIEGGMAST